MRAEWTIRKRAPVEFEEEMRGRDLLFQSCGVWIAAVLPQDVTVL